MSKKLGKAVDWLANVIGWLALDGEGLLVAAADRIEKLEAELDKWLERAKVTEVRAAKLERELDVVGYVKRHDAALSRAYQAEARVAELEAEVQRVREYVRSDAYCPCCGDYGPSHSDDCMHRDERMELAREALYEKKDEKTND